MVEPAGRKGWSRFVIAACAGLQAGCAAVPKSRLDECHQLSRTLQSENSRLKDLALGLKAQNQDLNQRAVDDAHKLRAQGEEVQRLTSSVQAYQKERDQLADAFERIKRQIQASTRPLSASLLERFEDLARHRPGWEFDPASGVLTIASDALFEPGGDRVKPEARSRLRACAEALKGPEAEGVGLLVVGHTESGPVRRAGLNPGKPRAHLGLDRATRVRELLAAEAGIDPERIDVAGFEESNPGDDERLGRRIEVRLRRLDAGSAAIGAGLDAVEGDRPTRSGP